MRSNTLTRVSNNPGAVQLHRVPCHLAFGRLDYQVAEKIVASILG